MIQQETAHDGKRELTFERHSLPLVCHDVYMPRHTCTEPAHTQPHSCTHSHTYSHRHTHAYTHTHRHTHTHTGTHKHTLTVFIHTHAHTKN